MWAQVFDPGWLGGAKVALSTLGLLGIIVMVIWLSGKLRGRPNAVDSAQPLWRRVERGDLTQEKLEWLRPARATFLPLAPRRAPRQAKDPAGSDAVAMDVVKQQLIQRVTVEGRVR